MGRKKKVLLLKPPHSFYPLGMSYVSSTLERANIPYCFYDTSWAGVDIASVIKNEQFDICGIGGLGIDFLSIEKIVKLIKLHKPNTLCVIGGQITRDVDSEILFGKIPFDVAVLAESEIVLPELVYAVERGVDFNDIQGLIFRNTNGELIRTSKAPRVDLVKDCIRPSYDFYDHKKWIYGDTIPVLTGRGCNGACTFCAPSFRPFMARSFDDIFADISDIMERFNVNFIDFWSEVLFDKEELIIDFCTYYKRLNLPAFWCFLRADQDPKILKYLHEAGCVKINVGIESGSDEILHKMGKGLTTKQAISFIKEAKKVGIKQIYSGFMFGNQGETKEEINKTIKLEKKLNIGSYFHFTVPYPGTVIYKRARKNNVIEEDEYDYLKIIPKLFYNHDFQSELLYQHGKNDQPILPNQTSLSDGEFVSILLEAYVKYVERYCLSKISLKKIDSNTFIEGKCPICGTINRVEFNENSPLVRNFKCDGVQDGKCHNQYMCHAHIFGIGKVRRYALKLANKFRNINNVAMYGDNFIIKFLLDRNIFKISYRKICGMSSHVPDRAGTYVYGDEFGNKSDFSKLLTDEELLSLKPDAIIICLMPPLAINEKNRLVSIGHDESKLHLMCPPMLY